MYDIAMIRWEMQRSSGAEADFLKFVMCHKQISYFFSIAVMWSKNIRNICKIWNICYTCNVLERNLIFQAANHSISLSKNFVLLQPLPPSIPTFWGLLLAINWLWTLHVHSHYLRQYSSAALFTAPIFFLWCKNWIWGSIFNLLSYWVSTKCVISAYLQQSNITIQYLCTSMLTKTWQLYV